MASESLDVPGQAGEVGEPGPAPGPGPPPDAPVERWRPWHGRPRARDVVCLTLLMVSLAYSLVMIPLVPVLIGTRPVLLEVLSGSNTAIVAAGSFANVDRIPVVAVIAAAVPGLIKFDLLSWWAGVLWGPRAIHWLGGRSSRAARVISLAERRGSRFAAPAVAVAAFLSGLPAPLVYAAAGWVGLGPVTFLLCDALGSAAWAAVLAGLGYELGSDGVAAAHLVSRYALLATAVLIAAVAAPHVWRIVRARRARSRRAPDEPGPTTEPLRTPPSP
jgi:membrane protein DedA with SNARE-associated domain